MAFLIPQDLSRPKNIRLVNARHLAGIIILDLLVHAVSLQSATILAAARLRPAFGEGEYYTS